MKSNEQFDVKMKTEKNYKLLKTKKTGIFFKTQSVKHLHFNNYIYYIIIYNYNYIIYIIHVCMYVSLRHVSTSKFYCYNFFTQNKKKLGFGAGQWTFITIFKM